MTKNQIITKVNENYHNIWIGFISRFSKFSKKQDELKNFVNEFPDIENLFDENKFDEFCKYEKEHDLNKWIYSPLALLCGYMFKTHMNTTINNWPDSYENLVDSLHYWNYSSDILY